MHDASPSREPLGVSTPISGRRAQRVRVVYQASPDIGEGLEAPVGMRRKARYVGSVVHAPAVARAEVRTDLAPFERGGRTHLSVAGRIVVEVMNAEQERVDGGPLIAEGKRLEDR